MNLKQRVQEFWEYFISIQKDLENGLRDKEQHEVAHTIEDLNEHLTSVCGCKVEIEMSATDFFELTFTPGGNKTAQICCALLKKDAPTQLLDDWIINAFRQPLSEKAYNSVLRIKDKEFSGSDFKVFYTINEESRTLDLKIYCEALKGMDENYREKMVVYMLELFIGELELEARISSIEIIDEPSEEENVCLLPNLYEDICDIIVDKEWVEYHDPLAIYMAYKLDEKPVNETLRKDMKLIVTTNPQLQEELLNDDFTTCKELIDKGGEYGYLYFEKLYNDEKEALVRQQLEKEMNDLLYDLSIARTMGGAIGIYYSYIDVAIFDIDAFEVALAKVNEKMKFQIYYQPFIVA